MKTTSRETRRAASSKLQAFFLHAAANRFQDGEATVSFVQVKNARRDAHRLQRAETADAQQQFLADADAAISAIETRGQLPVFRRIALYVGIQQQQIAASDLHAPDFARMEPLARLDLPIDRFAVRADRRLHRQLIDVGLQIFLLLPAVLVEPLPEVSLPVKQSDSDQRNVRDRMRS